MMTFDEKFKDSLQNYSNIDLPDYTANKLNLYADFIELMSLFSNTDGIGFGDVLDRFFGTKDYSGATQRDKDETFIIRIFEIIEQRTILFSDDYPFTFTNSEILVLKEDLSIKNKLYLGMLVSSKLNIFKRFKTDLTTEFETISYYVFKNFLPANSIIKEFGKNSTYTGNAKKKITDLANDLGLKIDEDELDGISERNNQERGLDIIGWIPFSDSCMNQLIYLVQCACGKNTESKFHDTRRFENYFNFYKVRPQHIMFIPYSLININNNKFYHSDLIEKDFLIFERKRIIDIFSQDSDFFNNLEMIKIVDKCSEYVHDVV